MTTRTNPTRHTSQPARRAAGLVVAPASGVAGGAGKAATAVGLPVVGLPVVGLVMGGRVDAGLQAGLSGQGNFGRNSENYGESPG